MVEEEYSVDQYDVDEWWFVDGRMWEFDTMSILSGKCSKARALRFSFLARACELGNYEVVKALALPPYSLTKEEWSKQDEATSPNVQYICAFSFCYSQKGQHLLKEIVKPPWSFTEAEVYGGAFWCFLWDNFVLFEHIVGDSAISPDLQRAILNMAVSDPDDFRKGLTYVNGSVMIEYAVGEMGHYDPRFYEDSGWMKIVDIAVQRRVYAFFLASMCHTDRDSPMAMLPAVVIGKIANLMVLDNIIGKNA